MRPLLLILALLAAGCVDTAETAERAAPSEGDASAIAGESGAGAPDEVAEAEAVLVPIAVPVSYSGTTPEGSCSMLGCHWVTAGSEDFHPIEHEGKATKLAVQVTYRDVKPGMEFYIGLCLGDGADEASVSCDGYVTGPSPLVVEFDLAGHVAGDQVALSTGALNGTSTASGVMVFTASSFDVAGTLTVLG